ncbi:MAG: DUF29 domain-containing protein [Thermosynechococcus sp.]|uniref:DUF29 domain-containing protein n=1 Tax=Thermosynechococcus sp. TaxID=2814275 RepID=UPI00391A1EBD
MGQQERRELEHCLGILIGHLLKWDYQPQKRSKSWRATIRKQRRAVEKLIHQNPSLQPYLPQAIAEAYESGKDSGGRDIPLNYSHFPEACPYKLEDVLDAKFLSNGRNL